MDGVKRDISLRMNVVCPTCGLVMEGKTSRDRIEALHQHIESHLPDAT